MRRLRRGVVVAVGSLLAVVFVAAPAWGFQPSAPDQPTVTSGNTQIIVDFTASFYDGGFPIDSYTATCTPTSGPASWVTGPANQLELVVTGLTNGTTYTCTVHAHNTNNEVSDESTPSDPVTPNPQVPDTPAAPTATAGNKSAVVSFTPPADNGSAITLYTASCTSSDGGTFKSLSGTSSPITVTPLTTAKTYTCTVTATNSVGESNESENSNSVVPLGVPDAPTISSVERGDASVDVSFSTPLDNGNPITSFTATCTSSNGGASGSTVGPASPITVTGLTNARTYRCTARAANTYGNGPPSAPSAQVVPATIPNPPKIADADPGDGAASVNFTPQADNGAPITSYSASCTSTDGGATGTGTGTKSPVVVTGLTNGNTYSCSASATNAIGPSLASSDSPSFVSGEPTPPLITTIVPGAANSSVGSLTVSVSPGADNGSPITSYRVTCRPATGGTSPAVTSANPDVHVSGLGTGKSYSCAAVATNGRGTSRESVALSAIVGAPGPPKITKVAPLSHGLAFAFIGANPNGSSVVDYRVRCTSSNGGVSQTAVGTKSPISAGNLSVGGKYTCALAARNSRGTGAPATVGPIVVKPPSGNTLASCSGNSGTVKIDPGMQQKTAQSHTFSVTAKVGCTGPYVNAASVSFSMHSKRVASCDSAGGLGAGGPSTLFWTAPVGMGKSAGTFQLTITATGNHQTKATFSGPISSGNSIFKGAHVKGTLLLGRGFHPAGGGGDCSSTTPIASMPVTAISMTVS